jgi:hypothetical protein
VHRAIRLGVVATLLLVVASPTATAESPSDRVVLRGSDFSTELVTPPAGTMAVAALGALDDDPLGLVPELPFVQRYSLDTDHFEVWLCGSTGYTIDEAIAALVDTEHVPRQRPVRRDRLFKFSTASLPSQPTNSDTLCNGLTQTRSKRSTTTPSM